MQTYKHAIKPAWNGNPFIETIFILLPPFICLAAIVLFPGVFVNNNNLPDYWWVILILLIDVAHVYSTLYRTYFDKIAMQKHQSILWSIPFYAFIAGVLVYSISSIWFWRLLAYIAVFHFIRQQYGFVRVYSRYEHIPKIYKIIDTITIYAATVFPIVYWHLTAPRNFNWFVNGDFIYFKSNTILQVAYITYLLIMLAYIIKEIMLYKQYKNFNYQRVTIIVGTIISWYFGIVYFNGDMAFTLLNVVCHGIPYMALIWIYGNKNYKNTAQSGHLLKTVFNKYGIVLFFAIIFLLAYIEEGIWDAFVWKEHGKIFASFKSIHFSVNEKVLNFLVPLLALPQITHYIIDGFIWKIQPNNFKWSNESNKQ